MALRDTFAGVVILAFSLTAFVLTYHYRGGAELFPRIVSGVMAFCAVVLIIRGLVWPTEGERLTADEVRRLGICISLTIAYVLLLVPVGFVTTSIIYILATTYALGLRRHVMIWVTTFVVVFTVDFFFDRVVHTPLPGELIMNLF